MTTIRLDLHFKDEELENSVTRGWRFYHIEMDDDTPIKEVLDFVKETGADDYRIAKARI